MATLIKPIGATRVELIRFNHEAWLNSLSEAEFATVLQSIRDTGKA